MKIDPNKLALALRDLPDWSDETHVMRIYGVQGRYWLRRGFETYPGAIEREEFEETGGLV
ncbi:hypothetical protein [Aurantimonas sp. A3-2-R12]|uniref:hypothetical protein n=1 Tax=Aurantimonas sp. A3-2-R12 TaxID=3114362 RepID=UPI002E184FA4|nr:hypothetical protein [Aurantimonas sp. A3-2-R12]